MTSIQPPRGATRLPSFRGLPGRREWRRRSGFYVFPHREDGPAIEWDDGSKEWVLDGRYHRDDGPAVEDAMAHDALDYVGPRDPAASRAWFGRGSPQGTEARA